MCITLLIENLQVDIILQKFIRVNGEKILKRNRRNSQQQTGWMNNYMLNWLKRERKSWVKHNLYRKPIQLSKANVEPRWQLRKLTRRQKRWTKQWTGNDKSMKLRRNLQEQREEHTTGLWCLKRYENWIELYANYLGITQKRSLSSWSISTLLTTEFSETDK